MPQDDLLIEVGCEELPPESLRNLGESFAKNMAALLEKNQLAFESIDFFAAPRRLAVIVKALASEQPEQHIERRGPAIKAAYKPDGTPTPACLGFARSCGVDVETLSRQTTDKGEWLFYEATQAGQATTSLLPEMAEAALENLPIRKVMRWGDHTTRFVRPVHWVVFLYGEHIVPATILGQEAGQKTQGHRYHHPDAITITHAKEYVEALQSHYVLADFDVRKKTVRKQIEKLASEKNLQAIIDEALLDKVTAMVEWPTALLATFNPDFLEVPPECLMAAIQGHQSCFPLTNAEGSLQPYFITVSNIESQDPSQVIRGNERVMQARLSDAQFFYQTDRSQPLENWLERLKTVVFQKKLGTLFDKTERLAKLSQFMGEQLQIDLSHCERAAQLSKADLMSDMVGEFPELQGIAGDYYARLAGEPAEVATALREHYCPRFSGDALPETPLGKILALADRIDTLVGIFGIGQHPTGDKDPFALRRAAIGVVRILIEGQLTLDLKKLLAFSLSTFGDALNNTEALESTHTFILERLAAWYQEQHLAQGVLAAALAKQSDDLLDCHQRIIAVNHFLTLPEADALIAANKRVKNILSKNAAPQETQWSADKFVESQEKVLAEQITQQQSKIAPFITEKNYQAILVNLASLKESVDAFFDGVMVMADDPALRDNRLMLLANLQELFSQVADLAVLSR